MGLRATGSLVLPLVVGVVAASLSTCRPSAPDPGATPVVRAPIQDHVVFSTYLGGSNGTDFIRDVAVDSAGNIYVTGGTNASRFPTTADAYDRSYGGGDADAFVAKLTADGRVVWATFVGGPSLDRAYAIEVDRQGNVYIGGRAGEGFPVTGAAFQKEFQPGPSNAIYPPQNGFVAKLSSDGARLLWASYFGAQNDDPSHPVRDLAIAPDGDLFIASSTSTGRYPEAVRRAFEGASQAERSGSRDSVVARIRGDGSGVLWATYLGGSGSEWGEGSIAASEGGVYFLTVTESDDVATTAAAYDSTYAGGGDFLLAKLTATGKTAFATYVGGSGTEHVETHELLVDPDDNPIIASGTTSSDFPMTDGAAQPSYGGSGSKGTGEGTNYPGDIVVAKLSADGTRLLASTFLGGRRGEAAEGVAINARGEVFVTGVTFSTDFPLSANAFQKGHGGGRVDAFVATLSADMRRLLYSSYFGGSDTDEGRAAAADPDGRFLMGGSSRSPDWPVAIASQPSLTDADGDAVLVKLNIRAAIVP